MTYFIDFDRTMFDTDAFIEYLKTRADTKALPYESEEEFARSLDALALAGSLSFAPGELARFVYADVPEFLRAAGNEAIIVTHGNAALQRLKVGNALAGIPRVSAHYTGEMRKGPYLAPRYASFGGTPVFADDTPLELELVARDCAGMRLYEMRRDGGVGDGRWPVIRSLAELP